MGNISRFMRVSEMYVTKQRIIAASVKATRRDNISRNISLWCFTKLWNFLVWLCISLFFFFSLACHDTMGTFSLAQTDKQKTKTNQKCFSFQVSTRILPVFGRLRTPDRYKTIVQCTIHKLLSSIIIIAHLSMHGK